MQRATHDTNILHFNDIMIFLLTIIIINISCVTDFDYHNGHLCYECDQQSSPDSCDQVTLCDQDRVSLNEQQISVAKQHHIIIKSDIYCRSSIT